jgi:hypothetical protein
LRLLTKKIALCSCDFLLNLNLLTMNSGHFLELSLLEVFVKMLLDRFFSLKLLASLVDLRFERVLTLYYALLKSRLVDSIR